MKGTIPLFLIKGLKGIVPYPIGWELYLCRARPLSGPPGDCTLSIRMFDPKSPIPIIIFLFLN